MGFKRKDFSNPIIALLIPELLRAWKEISLQGRSMSLSG
jgi:hypothetical protein